MADDAGPVRVDAAAAARMWGRYREAHPEVPPEDPVVDHVGDSPEHAD